MIISSKIFTYTLESHNLWISNLWLVPWFGQISQLIRLCSVRLLLISCKDLSKYIEMVWRCFSAQLLAPVLALVAPSESKIGPRILSKNILGTFYLPQLVFCISETFLTLILGIGWAFFLSAVSPCWRQTNLVRAKKIPMELSIWCLLSLNGWLVVWNIFYFP